MTGVEISNARPVVKNDFIATNTSIPEITEIIADLLSLCLKSGNNPRIIGTEIGPTSGANQVTIRPNTPPNDSAFRAIMIVRDAKLNVAMRATISVFSLP